MENSTVSLRPAGAQHYALPTVDPRKNYKSVCTLKAVIPASPNKLRVSIARSKCRIQPKACLNLALKLLAEQPAGKQVCALSASLLSPAGDLQQRPRR